MILAASFKMAWDAACPYLCALGLSAASQSSKNSAKMTFDVVPMGACKRISFAYGTSLAGSLSTQL